MVTNWLISGPCGQTRHMPKHSDAGRKNPGHVPRLFLWRHARTGRKIVNWFKNLTIRSKVMGAFATILAITAILGVFSINRLATTTSATERLSSNYLVASDAVG